MRRKHSFMLSLLAACAAVCLTYGLYEWQLKQLELQQQVQVLAPAHFVDAGSQLGKEDLTTVTLTASGLNDSMLLKLEEVLGTTALMPLGRGEPLLDWKLGQMNLLPSGDKALFPIPPEYVLAISSDMRAGDLATVYATGAQGSYKLLDRLVTVASVKTSANREVQSGAAYKPMDTSNKEQLWNRRRQPNGAIASVNLLLTDDEWEQIDHACAGRKGQLVIALSDMFPYTDEED